MAQLAQFDLGGLPPQPGLQRSDGYVTYAEDDPEAYHPLAEFPAEEAPAEDGHADDLGEIPPPTGELFRTISDYDVRIEEMRAVLAESDARFAREEQERLAHEAREAAEWTTFLEERRQKTREWNKLHGLTRQYWNDETVRYEDYCDYDDELPDDGDKELEYRYWRLERDPSYRDGYEFQVTPAQEQLYLEFRATEIEIGRWSEPGLAELRKGWEAFLAARGLEIVLG